MKRLTDEQLGAIEYGTGDLLETWEDWLFTDLRRYKAALEEIADRTPLGEHAFDWPRVRALRALADDEEGEG